MDLPPLFFPCSLPSSPSLTSLPFSYSLVALLIMKQPPNPARKSGKRRKLTQRMSPDHKNKFGIFWAQETCLVATFLVLLWGPIVCRNQRGDSLDYIVWGDISTQWEPLLDRPHWICLCPLDITTHEQGVPVRLSGSKNKLSCDVYCIRQNVK